MSIHDGTVNLDDNLVPVIIGLDSGNVRMSSNGAEIGDWREDEVSIARTSEGAYDITAENETLRFIPNNPTSFAADVLGGVEPAVAVKTPIPLEEDAKPEPKHPGSPQIVSDDDVPPARPVTKAVFYLLVGLTGLLGIWALWSLVF